MRQRFRLTLVLLLLAISGKAQSNLFANRIKLFGVNKQWHSLRLPTTVLTKTQNGLADIRIYGFKGKDTIEVPYIIEKSADQIVQREFDFKIINESQQHDIYYYTFQSDNVQLINHIKLSFKQNNFDWNIELSGSNNNNEWFDVLTDYRILAIKNNKTDYHFTELNFPASKYGYYRLAIQATEKPQLAAAKMLKTDTLMGIKEAVAYERYEVLNDKKTKSSIINVKLKQVELISSLRLDVTNDFHFQRALTIEAAIDSAVTADGTTFHYRTLYNGSISSMETPLYNFDGTLAKALRITIKNNDDRPLNIQLFSLEGPIYELVAKFKETDYSYALFFGNKNINDPIYDLKNFEQQVPIQVAPLSLGKVETNPDFTVQPQKPLFKNKTWLWALMGLIISLLGFFTYKMLKEK